MTPREQAKLYGVPSLVALAKSNGMRPETFWHMHKNNRARFVAMCESWEKKSATYAHKMKSAFIDGSLACGMSQQQAELLAEREGY